MIQGNSLLEFLGNSDSPCRPDGRSYGVSGIAQSVKGLYRCQSRLSCSLSPQGGPVCCPSARPAAGSGTQRGVGCPSRLTKSIPIVSKCPTASAIAAPRGCIPSTSRTPADGTGQQGFPDISGHPPPARKDVDCVEKIAVPGPQGPPRSNRRSIGWSVCRIEVRRSMDRRLGIQRRRSLLQARQQSCLRQ